MNDYDVSRLLISTCCSALRTGTDSAREEHDYNIFVKTACDFCPSQISGASILEESHLMTKFEIEMFEQDPANALGQPHPIGISIFNSVSILHSVTYWYLDCGSPLQ